MEEKPFVRCKDCKYSVSKKEPKTIAGIPIERAITILDLWKANGSVPEIINYADGFEQGYKTRDKEYAKSFDTMIKIMEKKNETV